MANSPFVLTFLSILCALRRKEVIDKLKPRLFKTDGACCLSNQFFHCGAYEISKKGRAKDELTVGQDKVNCAAGTRESGLCQRAARAVSLPFCS